MKTILKLNKEIRCETVLNQVNAESTASKLHTSNVHVMNKRKWNNKQKCIH